MPTFTTGEAAKRIGVTPSAVRNIVSGAYSEHYRGLWSAGAVPEPGKQRMFDEGDIRLLAFVSSETARGELHKDIAERVRAGALDDFTPVLEEEPAQTPGSAPDTALAVIGLAQQYADRLQAIADAARQRESELSERLLESERARSAAETTARMLQEQLDELRAKEPEHRKGLFARLFGR